MTVPFSESILQPEAEEQRFLFEDASRTGRGGLGGIQVIAAGNARPEGAFTTGDPLSNMRQHVTVAAGSDLGDIINYSTAGPSLLVTAPVDVNPLLGSPVTSPDRKLFKSTTTDIPGIDFGFSGWDLDRLDSSLGPKFSYTTSMNGTSAAAPMVSGVVALMLEANPTLGYRDVQDILAISARAPWQQGEFELYPWQTNGAQTINGGGFRYSHDYGFGFVDAAAAVRLAESWQQQRTAANELAISSGAITLEAAIPADGANPFRFDITIEPNITVEWLELHTSFEHSHWGDLTLTLTSPTGTEHVLLDRIGRSPEFAFTIEPNNPWLERFGSTGSVGGIVSTDDGLNEVSWFNQLSWPFTSTVSRGENSAGNWSLSINGVSPDQGGVGGSGVLQDVELRLYGRPTGAEQPTLFFSDSYAPLLELEPERVASHSAATPLALNAAASSLDLRVDLRQGTASLGDAPILWDQATVVDAVFGGAGNDVITGSARNERLDGGWGDDLILYGGGIDIWSGGFGADVFRFDASQLNATVFAAGPTRVEILDFTAGLDRIELTGGVSGQFQLGGIDGNLAQLLWSGPGGNSFRGIATGIVELVNASGSWDPAQFVLV
jgi:subtilisin-like proprotein convertase family protein